MPRWAAFRLGPARAGLRRGTCGRTADADLGSGLLLVGPHCSRDINTEPERRLAETCWSQSARTSAGTSRPSPARRTPTRPYLPTRRIGDSPVLAGVPAAALPDYPTGFVSYPGQLLGDVSGRAGRLTPSRAAESVPQRKHRRDQLSRAASRFRWLRRPVLPEDADRRRRPSQRVRGLRCRLQRGAGHVGVGEDADEAVVG